MTAYSLRARVVWAVVALAVAVLIAGFWNFRAVDGFGHDFVAGNTIGDTGEAAGGFATRGMGFGMLFAAVAGLAATFTACNCVVFAMLPGLACSADRATGRKSALTVLGVMIAAMVLVTAFYGVFIGFLGPEGIQAFNLREVRLAQAQAVFSGIGVVLLIWGAIDLGFLRPLVARFAPETRTFFARPTTRAALMGIIIGLFAVGRPFGVFRDFLTYAAEAHNPLYGAAVMTVQGLGQIAVMVALALILVLAFGNRLARWVATRPHQPALISALALMAGGTYFLYYWGAARIWDVGSWGFKLGLYS